jgi:hypothetical protein
VHKVSGPTLPDHGREDLAMCGLRQTAWQIAAIVILLHLASETALPQAFMSHTHHHHHPGRGHPPARLATSILRLSVVQRLMIAAVAIAVLWAAVFWAIA